MLLFPEGDHAKRRHAHTACVINARKAAKLPTKDEWLKAQRPARTQPPGAGKPGWLQRVLGRDR
jgi:hypothetical protein